MDTSHNISLIEIRILHGAVINNLLRLNGIQLVFSNGIKTPFFKGRDFQQEDKVVIIDVDPKKVINGISMMQ